MSIAHSYDIPYNRIGAECGYKVLNGSVPLMRREKAFKKEIMEHWCKVLGYAMIKLNSRLTADRMGVRTHSFSILFVQLPCHEVNRLTGEFSGMITSMSRAIYCSGSSDK